MFGDVEGPQRQSRYRVPLPTLDKMNPIIQSLGFVQGSGDGRGYLPEKHGYTSVMVSRAAKRSRGVPSRVLVMLAGRSGVTVITQHISRALLTPRRRRRRGATSLGREVSGMGLGKSKACIL